MAIDQLGTALKGAATNGHAVHPPAATASKNSGKGGAGSAGRQPKTFRSRAWSLAGPLSALLMILAFPVFPRFQLWPLAWIALVPLLCCLYRGGWKRGVQQGLFFGYPFMVGVLAWVWWMGVVPWLLLALTQAAYVTAFTVLVTSLAPLWTDNAPSRINGDPPLPPLAKGGLGGVGKAGDDPDVESPPNRTETPDRSPRSWLRHLAALALPAAAWIFMEWMRSLGTLSIPWGFVSSTQVHLQPLVTTARWWGAYGVSFLIVMVNGGIANWVVSRGRDRRRAAGMLAAAGAVVAASCILSVYSFHVPQGKPLKVALIQGNVPKAPNADPAHPDYYGTVYAPRVMADYTGLSYQAAQKHPDVIVWPETVLPYSFFHDPVQQSQVRGLAQSLHAYFLVGSPDKRPDDGRRYNSSVVVAPDGSALGRYDKEHIVPFGEFVPGRSWLPFLDFYGVPPTDLIRGKIHAPITTPAGRLGVMICYESMYPQIARQTVQHDAEVLLVITNDEWFGVSSAPYDHAADAVFRAVETGRWIVQAGTTGISLFADPSGHTYGATPMFQKAVAVKTVRLLNGTTLYTRLGDWPPLCAISLLLTALCFRGLQGYRKKGT